MANGQPQKRHPQLARDLLLIDVETTGLDSSYDMIVQLAAVVLDGRTLREMASFVARVKPEVPISAEAMAVHGLSEADLAEEPALVEVIHRFDQFAPADVVLAGHNVSFDYRFLAASYSRVGIPFRFDYHTLDVWSLAFFILGAEGVPLPRFSLDHLCSLYGIPRSRDHDALGDVTATAQILRYFFTAVAGRDLEVLGQYRLFPP